MINICLVFHGAEFSNGGTRSFLDIIEYLISTKKYHIEAVFPCRTGSAIDYLKSMGVEDIYYYKYGGLMQDLSQTKFLRICKVPLLLIRWILIRIRAKKLAKKIKSHNIDLIYSNTSSIVFGGYLGLALKARQAWHVREYREKDHQISFFFGEKWLKRFINMCAGKVFFVSEGVMNYNTDYIDKEKCFVTYNSYDARFIEPKETFFNGDCLKILLAGDIRSSKGQLEAVKAIGLVKKKNPSCKVKLYLAGKCGQDAYLKQINDVIAQNKLEDDVIFLGYRTDMDKVRSEMDVGLCTSNNEAFGRTVVEGMLSMLAMIGKKSGGTIEQIVDGETGLFYDGSVEDLADKILQLYTEPELLKKCATNGFDFAVPNFTRSNSAKVVEAQIDNLLND